MLIIAVGRPVVGFELLITVLIQIQVFDVTPCGWVNNDLFAACIFCGSVELAHVAAIFSETLTLTH